MQRFALLKAAKYLRFGFLALLPARCALAADQNIRQLAKKLPLTRLAFELVAVGGAAAALDVSRHIAGVELGFAGKNIVTRSTGSAGSCLILSCCGTPASGTVCSVYHRLSFSALSRVAHICNLDCSDLDFRRR